MVWKPPRRAYGAIIGYDVHFFILDTGLSRIVHKERDEFHHLVSQEDVLSGPGRLIVQVSMQDCKAVKKYHIHAVA